MATRGDAHRHRDRVSRLLRVLLDEVVPRALARALEPHVAEHADQRGWLGVQNGELLRLAQDAGFEAFVTLDTGIPFQQNIAEHGIAVIILQLPAQGKAIVLAAAPDIISALDFALPGSVTYVKGK